MSLVAVILACNMSALMPGVDPGQKMNVACDLTSLPQTFDDERQCHMAAAQKAREIQFADPKVDPRSVVSVQCVQEATHT